ncbi:LacI family DNA-binding transcriptional regulator [Amygdalobacter nucleatus]|uniref:LacI family DNA-binding transcriptional regulator n=1 Tax=Amygdalobacter nucleatus TaxID=3029274 RepID=UPI000831A2AE|nr:LacI family DNA-binding transcriptional regulator [Amygdalobacter nucleatus]MDF0485173.1 LacI family DNA-binding transcriptional regulator [Amygdalobacter nucleatus]WEG36947.1 LacI family DNA-binding transcriptional regulator [Amygdalobacter nucleatus]
MASTIRDVAARAGLSVGTVSKYINGKTVKNNTRLAIEAAVKDLNFRPNSIAKGLRNAKSFSVAVLLPMLSSMFCTSMISSIEATLLPLGYSVIVCECHNDAEVELRKTQFLIDRLVDGIILIPYGVDGRQIEIIQKNNIPLVLLDQVIKDWPTDCVVLDNEKAGYESTRYLIEQGHKNIAIITGDFSHYTTVGRLAGYKRAMQESGISNQTAYIQCGDYSVDGGYNAMLRLWALPTRPSAVFISNHDMTIGAYLAINYLKLKIPDDISVIGFDNSPLANVVNPPLSFAEQPTNQMGIEAGKLLYRRICGDYSDYPRIIYHKPSMHYTESIRKL